MSFENYLMDIGFSTSSIKEYKRRSQLFRTWLSQSRLDEIHINYRHLMEYVQILRSSGKAVATVNNEMIAVKAYFDYLILKGIRIDNPAEGIVVRGSKRKVLHNLLSEDQLEELYHGYEIKKNLRADHEWSARRNKVIVGLLVFQGLTTTDLKAMEIDHALPDEGIIYVPGSRKMKRRKLELKAFQVLPLDHYVKDVHDKIAGQRGIRSERLFIPNERLTDTISAILKQLRGINSLVQSSNQIRASVISNWLKKYNIRKVQYLSGHKFISSTEAFKQNNMEQLQEAVKQFHPLR